MMVMRMILMILRMIIGGTNDEDDPENSTVEGNNTTAINLKQRTIVIAVKLPFEEKLWEDENGGFIPQMLSTTWVRIH